MLETNKWRHFINLPKFSTISNKRKQHAYLRSTSKNVSNTRRTPNKRPNKHNSNTQCAPTSIQHHRGRPRQSTSKIGPRNLTFRIRFTSATQNFNAALHYTRLRTISKGCAHPLPNRHSISKGGTTATVTKSQLHPLAKIHLS